MKNQIVHLFFWYLKWLKCPLLRETVRKTFTAQTADNIEPNQNTGDIYETFSRGARLFLWLQAISLLVTDGPE
jgi:hypothetical protein